MTSTPPPWKIDNQAERIAALKQIKDARICEAEEAAQVCEEHRETCTPSRDCDA